MSSWELVKALPLGKWALGSSHRGNSGPAQAVKWFSQVCTFYESSSRYFIYIAIFLIPGNIFKNKSFLISVRNTYSKVLNHISLLADTLICMVLSTYWLYNKVMTFLFVYVILIYFALLIFITSVPKNNRCLLFSLWTILKNKTTFGLVGNRQECPQRHPIYRVTGDTWRNTPLNSGVSVNTNSNLKLYYLIENQNRWN